MILAIAQAMEAVERALGRMFTQDEADRFRAAIRSAYKAKGLLLIAVAMLSLGGCGEARQINVGATGPWKVTISSVARVEADYRGPAMPNRQIIAWCDHQEREIRIPYDLPKTVVAAVTVHEVGHLIERDYPRIWVILDALDAPGFRCGSDELHATQRAQAEAAAATAKGTNP